MTRVTYDIDIVVQFSGTHVEALAGCYPAPRYYADPVQMRRAISTRTVFNIIDTERGEKADLIPTTTVPQYRQAFRRRVRQTIDLPMMDEIEMWSHALRM